MLDYNLYLKYNMEVDLNVKNNFITPVDYVFAEILHETDEAVKNAGDDELPDATWIGFVYMMHYNQALAMDHGLTMTDFNEVTFSLIAKPLLDLDYTLMNEETINAVGMASNPNIMMLLHFGIVTRWRNKGIGEQALKGIIRQMKGHCGYIVVRSQPPQHREQNGPDSLYEKRGIQLAAL